MSGRKLKKRNMQQRLKTLRKCPVYQLREALPGLKDFDPKCAFREMFLDMREYKSNLTKT